MHTCINNTVLFIHISTFNMSYSKISSETQCFSWGPYVFSHLFVLYVPFLYIILPLRPNDGPYDFGSSTLCLVRFIRLIYLWLVPFNSYTESHCRKKTMYLVILMWSTFKVFPILDYKQCWNILLQAFFCTLAGLLGYWCSRYAPRPVHWHSMRNCQECKFPGPTLRKLDVLEGGA